MEVNISSLLLLEANWRYTLVWELKGLLTVLRTSQAGLRQTSVCRSKAEFCVLTNRLPLPRARRTEQGGTLYLGWVNKGPREAQLHHLSSFHKK